MLKNIIIISLTLLLAITYINSKPTEDDLRDSLEKCWSFDGLDFDDLPGCMDQILRGDL